MTLLRRDLAPYDKKHRSEHHTLFPLFGEGTIPGPVVALPVRDSGGEKDNAHGVLSIVGHFQGQVHVEVLRVIRGRSGREPDLHVCVWVASVNNNGHPTKNYSSHQLTSRMGNILKIDGGSTLASHIN